MDLLPIVRLHGDARRARTLVGRGLTELSITKNLMSFQDLKQYKRKSTFSDGSTIICRVSHGIHFIDIYVRPLPGVPEFLDEVFYQFAIIPFYHELDDEGDEKDAQFVTVRGDKFNKAMVKRRQIGDSFWTINGVTPYHGSTQYLYSPISTAPLLVATRSYTWNKTGNDLNGTTVSVHTSTVWRYLDELLDIRDYETYEYVPRAHVNGAEGLACGYIIDSSDVVRIFRLEARIIHPPLGWGACWVAVKFFSPLGELTQSTSNAVSWTCTVLPEKGNLPLYFRHGTIGYENGKYYTDSEIIWRGWDNLSTQDPILLTYDKAWDFDPVNRITVSKQFHYIYHVKIDLIDHGTFSYATYTDVNISGVIWRTYTDRYIGATVRLTQDWSTSTGNPISATVTYTNCNLDFRYDPIIWGDPRPDHDSWISCLIGAGTKNCEEAFVYMMPRILCCYDWTDISNKWKAYDHVRTFTGVTTGTTFTGSLFSRILDYNGNVVFEKAIEVENEYLYPLSVVELRANPGAFTLREHFGELETWDDMYAGTSANGWPNETFEELYAEMNNTRFIHSIGSYLPDETKPEEIIHYEQRHKVNSDATFKEYDAWITVETGDSRKRIKLLDMPEKPWRWTGNHREIALNPNWSS